VGEVVEAPDADLARGQTIVAAMGGMGRDYDGGYAQYPLLPVSQAIPVATSLPWPRLGEIPESFGTAWGSLDQLGLEPDQSLLIRGASSSVGMAAITIAKDNGLTVFATTRQERKRPALEATGADHVVIDDGQVAARVREIAPDGLDRLLELVGPRTIRDSFKAVAPGGSGLHHGISRARLEPRARPRRSRAPRHPVAQIRERRDQRRQLPRDIPGHRPPGRGRPLSGHPRPHLPLAEIADAHRYMEENRAPGKVVGLPPQ
jgi:NADPH:quinone reductase